MYKYPGVFGKDAHTKGALQKFALSGYQQTDTLAVPPPQSFVASAMKELFATKLVSIPKLLYKATATILTQMGRVCMSHISPHVHCSNTHVQSGTCMLHVQLSSCMSNTSKGSEHDDELHVIRMNKTT